MDVPSHFMRRPEQRAESTARLEDEAVRDRHFTVLRRRELHALEDTDDAARDLGRPEAGFHVPGLGHLAARADREFDDELALQLGVRLERALVAGLERILTA